MGDICLKIKMCILNSEQAVNERSANVRQHLRATLKNKINEPIAKPHITSPNPAISPPWEPANKFRNKQLHNNCTGYYRHIWYSKI